MTVRPWELLGRTRTPDGDELTFMRQKDEYLISANGRSLMSSRVYGSETSLAVLGCEQARLLAAPCVLVGGLGMGFTLRSALDLLPPTATVVVSELLAAVVEWNRGPLGALTSYPLDDPRVSVDVADIAATLRTHPGRFDAILLDVDNGPAAFTSPANAGLYGAKGLAAFRRALTPGGVLAVWSAGDDPRFRQRLREVGFNKARVERVRGRGAKGPRHSVFLAEKGPG
jgi:spermidine synthase